ncbi:hypothetical protein DL95DRAFT_377977, partial [Leptodontidium sp. 2 PMI_412]
MDGCLSVRPTCLCLRFALSCIASPASYYLVFDLSSYPDTRVRQGKVRQGESVQCSGGGQSILYLPQVSQFSQSVRQSNSGPCL